MKFPKVAELVGKAVDHKTRLMNRTDNPPSTEELAKAIGGISQAGVWNYLNGIRIPPEKKAEVMAGYLYKDDPRSARKFCEQLRQEWEQRKQTRKEKSVYRAAGDRNLLNDLANDEPLRVRASNFPPFSNEFINQFFDHLCSLSNLKQEPPEQKIDDLSKALWNGQIDLATGYLATLKRAKLMHSWSTPIRIGLGGVILKRHKGNRQLVQDVLSDKSDMRELVRPIVVHEQAGAIHCLQRLKYSEEQVVFVDSQEPAVLKQALERTARQLAEESSQVTPVVVVNEYSSFKLLEALDPNGVPVMPLSSRAEASRSPRQQLPLFFLSLGCSRRRHDIRDLMEQLLTFFLGTEIESTSAKLLKLHQKLIREVERFAQYFPELVAQYFPELEVEGGKPSSQMLETVRFLAAYHWTSYVLGLDELSLESYSRSGLPWRTILQRTRKKMLEQLTQREKTIKDLIAMIAGSQARALPEEQFKRLCHFLDLHPERLTEVQREYVLEDHDILLRTLQNILRREPIGLPIEKEKKGGRTAVVDPRDNPRLRLVADGFLAELQRLYKQQVDENVLQGLPLRAENGKADTPQNRVEKFRAEMRAGKFGDAGQDEGVILASFGPAQHLRHVGFACVKPYRGENSPGRSLELCYLWIAFRYRKLRIAESIVAEACRFALKQQRYDFLVIEVVQTMNEMVTYFQKRGFLEHGDDGYGRLVFKLPVKAGQA